MFTFDVIFRSFMPAFIGCLNCSRPFELCGLNTSRQATAAEEVGNHPAPRRALFTALSHNKSHHGLLGLQWGGSEWGTPLTNDWSAVIHNRWQVSKPLVYQRVTYVPWMRVVTWPLFTGVISLKMYVLLVWFKGNRCLNLFIKAASVFCFWGGSLEFDFDSC